MKISIGSDHRGVALKQLIQEEFSAVTWLDVGAETEERSDYPFYAKKVVESMQAGDSQYGILICGSGVGMAVAANRHQKIYAALCWSPKIATVAHEDDGVNVLALSSDYLSESENIAIVRAMITAWEAKSFKGGRYAQRLAMIDS